MIRKKITIFVLITIIVLLTFTIDVAKPQSSRPRVFIRPNGNVDPASAPIQRNDNVYTFTGDVYAELTIEKADIVLDGAGYILHGPYNGTQENLFIIGQGSNQTSPGTQIPYSIGVDLAGDVSGLTIRNLNIKNFSIGTYIWTKDNTFVDNSVSECVVGVLLSGANNSVHKNYLMRNEIGLFFGTTESGSVPLNLTVSHNSFVNNIRQLGGCLCQQQYNASEPIHTWDDGKEGNYWSDYNGTDANGDGIGDTPYVFDPQNEDRYPLMVNSLSQGFPVFMVVLVIAVLAVIVAIAVDVWRVRRKRKQASEQ